MKINEITEAQVVPYSVKNLKVANAVKLLNKHCSESLSLIQNPIWRGMRHDFGDIMKIDPSTGVRKSNNTMNYYTELMDHSPYFEGWPKRSKSLICSLDFRRANSYSESGLSSTYAVFPGRGVKVAVCPGDDIWETEADIPLFGGYIPFPDINYYLHELGLAPYYESMVNAVKSPHFERVLVAFCKERNITNIPNPEDVLPQIMDGMQPEVTGFHLMELEEIAVSGITNKEVWLSGPCILVRKSIIDQINDRNLQAFNNI